MPENKNQGEGDRESARRYNEHAREHVKSGKSEQAAERAREDIEGPEAADLERAEREGKKRIAEEDPNARGQAAYRPDDAEDQGDKDGPGSP